MTFEALPLPWQRIFTLEWQSLCEGSRAIAAVITDADGRILSEGRNRCAASTLPNPRTAHAESEAVISLDIAAHPDLSDYTLHTGLEPCVMCMGTLVMGGIRRVEIGAQDDFGGAMGLLGAMEFLRHKQIHVTWADPMYGEMQRAFQTVRELVCGQDPQRLSRILTDFCVHNRYGTMAAQALVREEALTIADLSQDSAQALFDRLAQRMAAL